MTRQEFIGKLHNMIIPNEVIFSRQYPAANDPRMDIVYPKTKDVQGDRKK